MKGLERVSDVRVASDRPSPPRGGVDGGEVSAAPGAIEECIHPGQWVTRVDGGGRCRFVRGRDGSRFVVVRQHSGRSWHRGLPGPVTPCRYELRLSDVVVSSHDATFTTIRQPESGWVLVVLEGSVLVSSPAVGAQIELPALQALTLSPHGEIGRRRQLAPADIDTQPWVVANRARDLRLLASGPSPGLAALPPPAARRRSPAPVGPENLGQALQGSAAGWARRLHSRATPRMVGLTVLAALTGLGLLPDQARTMMVTVNGRQVRMSRSQPTVAAALVAADLENADGAILAAGTKTVIEAQFAPARVVVNRSPASRTTKVEEGAQIDVTPAPDVVEATDVRQAAVPPPPLPPVEYNLWYPGTSGTEDQVYGTLSGQIVSRTPVVDPIPPRPERGNVVALTFDDGPHPVWTPQILDILRSEGIKATFCVVGALGEKHPELIRAERDAGHAMCNHTQHHVIGLDRASPEQVVGEIAAGARFLQSTLGEAPTLYRPPGGNLGPVVIETVHRGGMRVLGWTVDSRDYTKPPVDALVATTLAAVRPGAVILLHDGDGDRSQTVAALRPLIQQLRARGFSFATPLAPPGG